MPVFMKRCYGLIREASNEVSPENFAYLHDRICYFEGTPQKFGTQFLREGPKTKEKLDFQSFQKSLKKAVNPANPTICRVFSFIPLFNIYKIEQNLCGTFVAHLEWSGYLFCHKKLKRF